jgi:hypothetical protein
VITELRQDAIRWEGERPVAVGDQELTLPTRIARTGSGFWGIYGSGDDVVVVHPGGAFRGPAGEVRLRLATIAGDRDADRPDRDVAASFLVVFGGDDPGAASQVPRSRVESPPPPTYRLSDPTNSPPNPAPPPGGQGEGDRGSPAT